MATGRSSRWSRRFVVCSAGWLVLWRFGAVLGIPRRTAVVLALFGFVFHMVFGMGYLLIPSYFGRVLSVDRAPAAHLGLAVLGTTGLAIAAFVGDLPRVEFVGASAWSLGVVFFLGSLLWTVRDNLTGRETGTGAARETYQWVDRYANPFVPIALGYLAVGSYEVLARTSTLPGVTDGYPPRSTHLLAAGFATLLVFALGVRLAPRFLGVPAPKPLVAVVLPAGAVGPMLVAVGLPDGVVFVAGALVEATAVIGFATLCTLLLVRSDRRRVGFYGVLVGAFSGVVGVVLGLWFAFESITAALILAHLQLNLLGFLGLVVVGFAVQFFPPTAGRFRGANDRTALAIVAALASGLALAVLGLVADVPSLEALGEWLTLAGALGYGYLVVRLMIEVGSRQSS